jgi:hypothetical protein
MRWNGRWSVDSIVEKLRSDYRGYGLAYSLGNDDGELNTHDYDQILSPQLRIYHNSLNLPV